MIEIREGPSPLTLLVAAVALHTLLMVNETAWQRK